MRGFYQELLLVKLKIHSAALFPTPSQVTERVAEWCYTPYPHYAKKTAGTYVLGSSNFALHKLAKKHL